jgi:DNA (cytosine-5)-methyltransferase 1
MRYASVCDGIGAAHVAWQPLGWECAWTSEIEPFPAAVVDHHWKLKNLGDMTAITEEMLNECGSVDLLVGGTPCQSFSIAGKRLGLDDPRGNLALRFCQLAAIMQPRWIVWENVPGVLSSNDGRDFDAFLRGMASVGYFGAYRTLDAQYFGVPQRRRRVFAVFYLGDWRRGAAVLLEPAGYSPPAISSPKNQGDCVFGYVGNMTPKFKADMSLCLNLGGGEGFGAVFPHGVARKFTPKEYERLQGFPDDYTLVTYRNKPAADGPRYRALGNSMAVPVMAWIGQRIQMVKEATNGTQAG